MRIFFIALSIGYTKDIWCKNGIQEHVRAGIGAMSEIFLNISGRELLKNHLHIRDD
jgi:hypothetical protein